MEAICAREMNVKSIALFLLKEVILARKDILLKIVEGTLLCYRRNWLGTLA